MMVLHSPSFPIPGCLDYRTRKRALVVYIRNLATSSRNPVVSFRDPPCRPELQATGPKMFSAERDSSSAVWRTRTDAVRGNCDASQLGARRLEQ